MGDAPGTEVPNRPATVAASIALTLQERRDLDRLLNAILDMYASGRLSQNDARSLLAHVFMSAVMQNETEVRAWLKEATLAQWLDASDACAKTANSN